MRIRWGLEICYLPGYESLIREQLRAFPYDFAVGSIHWVEGFGFDHKAEFWEGKDPEALYRSYYALMLQMVKTGLFSGVAHPASITIPPGIFPLSTGSWRTSSTPAACTPSRAAALR